MLEGQVPSKTLSLHSAEEIREGGWGNQNVGPWAKIGIKAQKVSTLSHLIKPLPNQPTIMKG